MNCDRASLLLESHLDGTLGPEEQGDLNAHLDACLTCRAELAAIHLTDQAFLELADEEPPINIAAAVRTRIAEEAPAEPRRGLVWGAIGLAAALMALILEFGVAIPPSVLQSPAARAVRVVLSFGYDLVAAALRPVAWVPGALLQAWPVLWPVATVLALLAISLTILWIRRQRAPRTMVRQT
jgi:anti-sigma factor RsiW